MKTRHLSVGDMEGIEFKAKIDDPSIELRRCVSGSGTSIKIFVSDPEVFENLRPLSWYDARNINPSSVFQLRSWQSVNWFLQEQPKILYRWRGYNYGATRDIDQMPNRFAYSAEFHPAPEDFTPLPGGLSQECELLNEIAPYKAIFWRYIPKRKSKEVGFEGTRQPAEVITVNGILISSVSHHERGAEIRVDDELLGGGPIVSVVRPSLAIFDPAGVCPLNLQRDSIAFEKMDINVKLFRSILTKHFFNFQKEIGKSFSFKLYLDLCHRIRFHRGVSYRGQFPPVAITRDGIFLATPKFFYQLKIHTVFFVSINKGDDFDKLENLISGGEALLVRFANENVGIQSQMAWLRGAFTGGTSGSNSYASYAGFPRLRQLQNVSIILNESWKLTNEKGKLRKDILSDLICMSVGESHCLIRSALDVLQTDVLVDRAIALLGKLPQSVEIAAWSLDDTPIEITEPVIASVWGDVFGGPIAVPLIIGNAN